MYDDTLLRNLVDRLLVQNSLRQRSFSDEQRYLYDTSIIATDPY